MSLCQVLVNHISIRLYASQEISQKRFNRTATTAIIPVIVVEEISDILPVCSPKPKRTSYSNDPIGCHHL